MLAVKLLTVAIAPAIIGQINEPLAWLTLFVLPFVFAVLGKRKGN